MEKRVRELIDVAVTGDEKAREELKTILGFDQLNLFYFLILYKKFRGGSVKERMTISLKNGDGGIFPTAIACDELLQKLPLINYSELSKNESAKKAMLWIKKMQAGTGSSIIRKKYLEKFGRKNIGAKGTDLYTKDRNGNDITLVEAQILQAIADVPNFGAINLHDIVSNETEESIDRSWLEGYQSKIEKIEGIERGSKSFQFHIPTIDEEGEVSFKRKAPGGHALFGVEAMMAAYRKEMRPDNKGLALIGSVGNGEDLSSSPDSLMVSWMVDNKIPVAMVTTTKTEIDLKGGQIALYEDDNKTFVTMMEKAQADEAQQSELFMRLGLRSDDKEAFFNTNMVIINYAALSPLIGPLVDEIGEDRFLEIIAPDLIVNSKKQVDKDGKKRTYKQLEGAMGTVYLNLDQYWRKRYGKPIVHFINVDRENRTRFFSPVKTAFDFFMQFHSDRFEMDYDTYSLINKTPGKIPEVVLNDPVYKEVQNVLDLFADCKIKDLEKLTVDKEVSFVGRELKGIVEE